MNVSPTTIWQVPAYLPYLQPPLTDQALEEAERHIGHRIPDCYVALLRHQNGGYIRYSLPDSANELIYGIGPHCPSLTGVDWKDCQEHVSYQLEGLVLFDGNGEWYLCLDYRADRLNPSVTQVDILYDHEHEIAPSFTEYLALLQIEVDEDVFVMPGISDLTQTLSDLADRLRLQFKRPDFYSHGYPQYCARGGTKARPEWINISPNRVSRGFVREDDPRYEELRDLMPGEASRYPQLPESSYLAMVTDGLRTALLRACQEHSIEIRPLIEYVT